MKSFLEPDYLEHYQAWSDDPTPATAGKLLGTIDPVISSAVNSFGGSSSKSPTLKSRARKLALDALPSYDPTKGPLKTHLMSRLQRLRRIAGQEQQILQMPERVAMQRRQIEEEGMHLEEELGRQATDMELSDRTGISAKRLKHIRQAVKPISESLFAASVEDPNYSPMVNGSHSDAWTEFVHSDLHPRDQIIMEKLLGLHGFRPKSVTQIAKLLKVSPAAISQRVTYIQKQLDKKEELGIL